MPPKHENPLSKDFAMLRNRVKCTFCQAEQEERSVTNEDIADVLHDLQGIPWIDECKLYRYSKADEWNICNLCKQQLRLSEIGELNDMFEGIIPSHQQITEKDWKTFGKLGYVKCFSENWNNLLMWAHYADGGRGMCVEYDLVRIPDKSPILNHLYPVHYSERRYCPVDFAAEAQQITAEDNEQYWSERLLAYHLVKSNHWKYEQEWRLLVPACEVQDMQNTLGIRNQILTFPYVSAVYLGCKMPRETKVQIRNVVERINQKASIQIEIKELTMDVDSYDLTVK